jgi:hypothetical protein
MLCLFTTVLNLASAQITVTAGDVAATIAAGITSTGRNDTSRHTFDIGSPGSTSWDASTLQSHIVASFTSVDPDTTPYAGMFPGATHCQRAVIFGTSYSYFALASNLLYSGNATISPVFLSTLTRHPAEKILQLPLTFGTTWTSSFTDSSTSQFGGFPPTTTVSNQTVDYTVDAYGNLTMPGGAVYPALRVKSDRRIWSDLSYNRFITYNMMAANGASVIVVAADTLQSNNGTITVSSVSWNQPVTTDVRISDELPVAFALTQNYPNPFNPSTTIEFDLPRSSYVKLSVVNTLGEEVASLINRELTPGKYRETFNAYNLSTGVYFYRLQTSEGSILKKMMFLR